MKYLSSETLLNVYHVLSSNTETPDTQGATQKISAVRHLFAFYRFCAAQRTSQCDLKKKTYRDEFIKYVGEIVKLDGDNYTANFYTSITELSDCRVNSNFFSAGVVNKSRTNKAVIMPYPTNHGLFNVQNEVLIQVPSLITDIDEYLTSSKIRLAFALWLMRKYALDETSVIDSVRLKLSELYGPDITNHLIPSADEVEILLPDLIVGDFVDECASVGKNEILEYLKSYIIIDNDELQDQPYQQIFFGAPGTGKSYKVDEITQQESTIRTTFHPDSDYSTFVGAYKPIMREVPMTTVIGTKVVPVEDKDGKPLYESKIQYEFVPQAFVQAYIKAWKFYQENAENPQKQYLIIEEINRGNCAQIFGDLFQLLDRNEQGFSSYEIVPDNDLQKYIAGCGLNVTSIVNNAETEDISEAINTGELLCLPSNLYIWATMNTSDQSLFPIDSAFKRRWEWQYMPIEDAGKNWKIRVNNNEYDWYAFLTAINHEILALTHSEDKQLGYFFAKADAQGVIDAAKLVNKVYFYLWTDVFKDYETENNSVFKKADSNDTIAYKDFFVSGQKINEEVAEQILKNLKLNTPKAE